MRIHDPLKQWKLSPMDLQSRVRWEDYTKAKEEMFARTNIEEAPWHIVRANDKKRARAQLHAPSAGADSVRGGRAAPAFHCRTEFFNPEYERRVLPRSLYVPEYY